eukprot:TRINITY_DN36727_c0_g1_i1.p2 TRINITY_DN36727_c0_g1~~TRINITY_DN36727_c0_g1_i1.p2  ORF type:complete len:106 (-),score=8.04 TRINITY_DN36727_c0_g1_i1:677-994(-)
MGGTASTDNNEVVIGRPAPDRISHVPQNQPVEAYLEEAVEEVDARCRPLAVCNPLDDDADGAFGVEGCGFGLGPCMPKKPRKKSTTSINPRHRSCTAIKTLLTLR